MWATAFTSSQQLNKAFHEMEMQIVFFLESQEDTLLCESTIRKEWPKIIQYLWRRYILDVCDDEVNKEVEELIEMIIQYLCNPDQQDRQHQSFLLTWNYFGKKRKEMAERYGIPIK